jgi:hypothetical protein
MKRNFHRINLIGRLFCFLLLVFFSFQSNAYPAPSSYFDTVQKIYIGYYQRPADPGGLIYWAGRLDSAGGSFAEIIEAYANSAESQALYGTINSGNISNVVNGIYNALFGRPAEPEGLNYYVNGFNLGQFTPATIMLNVLYGAQNEDLQSVNNKLTAANLFTRTIDPELDGTNFQVTYAGDGDAIAGRNFLSFVTSSSSTVPTQDQANAYMRNNVADLGDAIHNTNTSPVANAGDAQSVNTGSTVFLDGSSSYDPNNDPITFLWSFVSRPLGNSAVLYSTTSSAPYFVANTKGNYTVSLTVSDGELSSSDTVTITATSVIPPPQICCKHCTTGKPCGDTCISKSYTCHVSGGCACY